MNIVKQLDDLYRQLVEIYSSVSDDKLIQYNIRQILEEFEIALSNLHGETWMPSDLF